MHRAAALLVSLALAGAAPLAPASGWTEIAWPFPRDAWPAGRAFRGSGCDLEVFVRPKLGFCNCTRGVTDDAEVDALSDIDMLGPDFTALEQGEFVHVAELSGRAQPYLVRLDPYSGSTTPVAVTSPNSFLASPLAKAAIRCSTVITMSRLLPSRSWANSGIGIAGIGKVVCAPLTEVITSRPKVGTTDGAIAYKPAAYFDPVGLGVRKLCLSLPPLSGTRLGGPATADLHRLLGRRLACSTGIC